MINAAAKIITRDFAKCGGCGGFGFREYSCRGDCGILWSHIHTEPCVNCNGPSEEEAR